MTEEDEASIVWPDQTATLADGRDVLVRQLRAAQEDRHHADVVPIRRAIREQIGRADDADTVAAGFYAILDEHGPALSRLVRACTGLTDEDWESLTSDDLARLRITWLGVHLRPFAQLHLMVQMMVGAVASGGSSSPAPSSERDTPETPET
jgi:hypothetical protein